MKEDLGEMLVDLSCQPLCQACSGETRSMFVYLCSGAVLKIGNSRQVRLTGEAVIVECGDNQAVEFCRHDVHFISCKNISPPFLG